MDEILVNFGGELKALDNGHFGGYLVKFSSPDNPDLEGDYFDSLTDFGIESGQKTPIYFHHRMPLPTRDDKYIVIKSKIGEGTLTIDENGVLIDAIIFNRERYEQDIIKAGRARKSDGRPYLGWSSGTAAHLCDKEKRGGANYIKFWQLGVDASVTPTPAEPVNDVLPLKSVNAIKFVELEELEFEGAIAVKKWDETDSSFRYRLKDPEEFEQDSFRTITLQKKDPQIEAVVGKLKGADSTTLQTLIFNKEKWTKEEAKQWIKDHPDIKKKSYQITPPVKGLFTEIHEDRANSVYALCDDLQCALWRAQMMDEMAEDAGVHFDYNATIQEILDEFSALITQSLIEEDQEDVASPLKRVALPTGLPFAKHSDMALAAVDEFTQRSTVLIDLVSMWSERLKSIQELRVKRGAVISAANKERLKEMHGRVRQMKEHVIALDKGLHSLITIANPTQSVEIGDQTKTAEITGDEALAELLQLETSLLTT